MIKTTLRPAITLFVLLSVITGIVYPLGVTVLSQALFPWTADGSLLIKEGRAVGSTLIGQYFTDPKYFWGRPSATVPQPYNGTASGGSNLGPLNPDLVDAVKERIAALKAADPNSLSPIPADLVTASGSGLDPHISPMAARYQLARVANARHLPQEQVAALIRDYTEPPQWGIFGEARVNVLSLNIALDGQTTKQ